LASKKGKKVKGNLEENEAKPNEPKKKPTVSQSQTHHPPQKKKKNSQKKRRWTGILSTIKKARCRAGGPPEKCGRRTRGDGLRAIRHLKS